MNNIAASITEPTQIKASTFGSHKTILLTTVALFALTIFGYIINKPLLIPPIAASVIYVFGVPGIPGTQPRSVVFGHLISAIIGFALLATFGHDYWVAVIAVAAASFAMNAVKLFHIPAVATTALVVLLHPGSVLEFLTLLTLSSLLVAGIGWGIAKTTKAIDYPLYW